MRRSVVGLVATFGLAWSADAFGQGMCFDNSGTNSNQCSQTSSGFLSVTRTVTGAAIIGSTASAGSFGVIGQQTSTTASGSSGVEAISHSPGSAALYSNNDAAGGTAMYANCNATTGSGSCTYSTTPAPGEVAIQAVNTSSTSGIGSAGSLPNATSGWAVYGEADNNAVTSSTDGVYGVSFAGLGYGVFGVWGGDNNAGTAAAGVYASGQNYMNTSGVPRAPALQVATGHAYFSGGNPSSSQAYQNTLTPKNFIKAWANISSPGNSIPSIVDGFNVSSVTCAGSAVRLTFASPMASANYGVMLTDTHGSTITTVVNGSKTTTTVDISTQSCVTNTANDSFDVFIVGGQ